MNSQPRQLQLPPPPPVSLVCSFTYISSKELQPLKLGSCLMLLYDKSLKGEKSLVHFIAFLSEENKLVSDKNDTISKYFYISSHTRFSPLTLDKLYNKVFQRSSVIRSLVLTIMNKS